MITDDIKNYAEQFKYEPEIKNAEKLRASDGPGSYDSYIIGGMGGSGLVAGVLRALKPELNIVAHHEYGLPRFLNTKDKKPLFVAISHSGNTEETIDFYVAATNIGADVAVITTGGKLLELAEEDKVPYVRLLCGDVQPRMTLGFMLRALLKLIGEDALYTETSEFAKSFAPEKLHDKGSKLADELFGKVPVVYASRDNHLLAYNWKLKFNESGKIPAFYNTFPELNHNEMQGMDVVDKTKSLSDKLCFVFMTDEADHKRIQKRMEITSKLYKDRGLNVEQVDLDGESRLERIFNTLTLGDWIAVTLAEKYGTEPEQVPMVEEFKKLL